MQVGTNTIVAISYTLREGEHVLDTASLGQPLTFLQGSRSVLPGLERALEGRVEDEQFQITLPPEDGYGRRRADRIKAVPRDRFPEELRLVPGMPFALETSNAQIDDNVWFVHEVWDDRVILDSNHPLAGKTLTMDVRIVSVRRATVGELKQGQAFARDMAQIGWEL